MMITYAILTFFTTILGGVIALKLKNSKHTNLLFGLSGGIILAVACIDILPEIFEINEKLGKNIHQSMLWFIGGIILFHIIEKYILIHHADEEGAHHHHRHPVIGIGGGLALIAHSFLDGIGIGLAFQVSPAIGVAVAVAVLAHDFADGINTVSLMLTHKNNQKRTFIFLIIDAVAPVLGVLFTLLFTMNENLMIPYLGIFSGFLIYIALSHILPEAHADKPSWTTVASTIIGSVLMYFVLININI